MEAALSTAACLEPTHEAGRAFVMRGIVGPVVMLNLLRFRAVADYSAHPQLAPRRAISGAQAFQRYIDHTLPCLHVSGGRMTFYGEGGPWLIGPAGERWDAAMLVEQRSVASFLSFASNGDYLKGLGHRSAALEDSRLLPLRDVGDWAAGDDLSIIC